jgi:HEAT repeat protein
MRTVVVNLQLLVILTALTAVAVALLTAVVALKKATRNRAEAGARARRDRYTALLLAGGEDADAMRQLARELATSRVANEALLGVLQREWDGVRLRYRHGFQDSVRAAGIVEGLLARLEADDPVERARAALVLGYLGLPESVTPLARLLDDRDGDARHAAARALGRVASEAAAWELIRGLHRGSLAPERILEQVGHPWAVDALLAAYHIAEFASVRAILAEALGLAGDPRAGAALAGILPFGSEEERVRCCRALGRAAQPATAPLVAAALHDEAWPVRAQAARALGAIGVFDHGVVMRLADGLGDPAWWVRANCAEALVAAGPAGRAALEAALVSEDRFARERAREALELERVRQEVRGS